MLLLAALLGITTADPIGVALLHYQKIDSYQATIRSERGGDGEIIRYRYQQPGLIRMEFIEPHKGAVLIYRPEKRRVYLWPFGFTNLPPLTLSPDNRLIQSPTGQKVDRSDVGTLLENVRALQDGGHTEVRGEEMLSRRHVLHIVVTGAPAVALGNVRRFELWLDRENAFPVKVISYNLQDQVIETVTMDEVQINPVFPDHFFQP